MNCPKCNARLRVSHSYPAGSNARARTLVCTGCRRYRATSIELVIREVREHGDGAYDIARDIESGAAIVEVDVKKGA